jgi:putative Holliday junction resolvase
MNNLLTAEEIVNNPDSMILMGLDISPRHCGIAVTDSKRIATKPLLSLTWNKRKYKKFLYHIAELAQEYKAQGFVIGLPINVYEVLPKSKIFIKNIGHNLRQITGLPHYFQEEHYSTIMATSFLRGNMSQRKIKSRQNEIAASYILQSFLEDNRKIVNN